jgi:hypothetical protein
MRRPWIAGLATLTMATAAAASSAANVELVDDVTCAVFPPPQIVPGESFEVRVSRVPGYPGSWFAPTVVLRLSYPTETGWAYEDTVSKTIPKMGVIRTDFALSAPLSLYPDPQGGLVPGGTVSIVAIVVEATVPTPRRTLCTASSVIVN